MAGRFINFNGDIYQEEEKVLTLANRGYRYGDGLFETMRMAKGKLKFADLHAERLQKSMKSLKIEGYSQMDAYFLKDKTEELVKRNKISLNARFRLAVYRNSEGLYTPTSNKNGYSLEVSPLETPYYTINAKGLIVDIYDDILKPVNKLSNLKTSSSLPFVMAGLYKKQRRLDEVFILNQNGFLCESLSANVFLVYKGQIYTPALIEGCVAGVMRQVVMDISAKQGVEVIEAQINPEILNEVEEVFITNAVNGIQWIMGFNKKRYFNEVSRTLSEKLNSF